MHYEILTVVYEKLQLCNPSAHVTLNKINAQYVTPATQQHTVPHYA